MSTWMGRHPRGVVHGARQQVEPREKRHPSTTGKAGGACGWTSEMLSETTANLAQASHDAEPATDDQHKRKEGRT